MTAQTLSSSKSCGISAICSRTADKYIIDVKTSASNSNINKNHNSMDGDNETNLKSLVPRVTDSSNKHGKNAIETQNQDTSEKQNQGKSLKQNEDISKTHDQSDKGKEDEIINLADDDDDEVCSNTCEVYERQDRGYINNCMNPDCTSGIDLAPPAMFVLTYFGMKKCRDQFICAECFNQVIKHQEVSFEHVYITSLVLIVVNAKYIQALIKMCI